MREKYVLGLIIFLLCIFLMSDVYSTEKRITATPTSTPQITEVIIKEGVNGYSGWRDTYLKEDEPTRNFGATQYDYLRRDEGYRCNFLNYFEIPEELINKEIVNAKLVFYCWCVENPTSEVYLTLYQMTREWVEGNQQKVPLPADGATWYEWDYYDGIESVTNNWDDFGGDYYYR